MKNDKAMFGEPPSATPGRRQRLVRLPPASPTALSPAELASPGALSRVLPVTVPAWCSTRSQMLKGQAPSGSAKSSIESNERTTADCGAFHLPTYRTSSPSGLPNGRWVENASRGKTSR